MASAVETVLHMGAHRTGSSSLQLNIDDNARLLRDIGYDLAYPGRDGAPGGQLRLKLPRPKTREGEIRSFVRAARKEVNRHLTGRGKLLLSEENVPGRMIHFYSGQFFPARRARFRVVRDALPGPVAHLLLVVRPYDELFISAYKERAKYHLMAPFGEIRTNVMRIREGWADVLGDAIEILRPARVTVVEYAARIGNRALLARLVPEVIESDLVQTHRRVNTSLPDEALFLRQAELSFEEGKPAPPRDGGFAEFFPHDRAVLRERYLDDLFDIARLGDLRLVTSATLREGVSPSTGAVGDKQRKM